MAIVNVDQTLRENETPVQVVVKTSMTLFSKQTTAKRLSALPSLIIKNENVHLLRQEEASERDINVLRTERYQFRHVLAWRFGFKQMMMLLNERMVNVRSVADARGFGYGSLFFCLAGQRALLI
jgi:hypothetical protein